MKRLTLAACALLLAAAALAAQDDGTFASPTRFLAVEGSMLYRDVCQGCHMPQAQGARGAGAYPALANNAKLESPAFSIALVLHGHAGMPSFGDEMTDQQIAAVVTFIRTHFGNDFPSPVTAEAVKAAR